MILGSTSQKRCRVINPMKSSEHKAVSADDVLDKMHWTIWPKCDLAMFLGFLEQHPELLDARHGAKMETLLHRACRYGNQAVAGALIERGASVSAGNLCGMSPLHLACLHRHIRIVKVLLDANAPVDAKDNFLDEPIHMAAKSGCCDILRMLKDHGAMVCAKGCRGNTFVHYAAQKGRLGMLKYAIKIGCDMNQCNDFSETPLHLAAAHFTIENEMNVKVIQLLLDSGADLNARSDWGDNAAHYAARWGSAEVLQYLCDKGISVAKPKEVSLTEEQLAKFQHVDDWNLSLLQKVAKSSCVMKSVFILDQIVTARQTVAKNMFNTSHSEEENVEEMNEQGREFLAMSYELASTSAGSSNQSVLLTFLKHCPDSLNHLFDRCIINCCSEQVQGKIYFDFFLFNAPQHSHTHDVAAASELCIVNSLIATGKERFLIHPLFEIFLKLKWYKTRKFYMIYVVAYALFMVSAAGFALTQYGQVLKHLPDPAEARYYCEVWQYMLMASHVYICLMLTTKLLKKAKFMESNDIKSWSDGQCSHNLGQMCLQWLGRNLPFLYGMLSRDILIPVLIGVVLYAPIDGQSARYCMACAVILISNNFMTIISRFPAVGLYVNMLSKVMMTVLNFMATYIWTFAGYAITFHILLPHIRVFSTVEDSFIKVVTMLMGEYEYVFNFVNPEESSWMSKIVFIVFVIDMSVVLMNLVLGLAISDIEELQRNSAVQRMIQETCTVMFIENFFVGLYQTTRLAKYFDVRVTSKKSCGFLDVTYLNLVDLDENPRNQLMHLTHPHGLVSYDCPHHLVQNVIKVVRSNLTNISDLISPQLKQGLEQMKFINKNQADIMRNLQMIRKHLGVSEDEKAEGEDAKEMTEDFVADENPTSLPQRWKLVALNQIQKTPKGSLQGGLGRGEQYEVSPKLQLLAEYVAFGGTWWSFDSARWDPHCRDWCDAMRIIQPEERDRIHRFRYSSDAKATLVGRLMLQLWARTAVQPQPDVQVRFERNAHGKPLLRAATNWDFNVSHHGNFVVLAADEEPHPDVMVGVDVMSLSDARFDHPDRLKEFFRLMRRQFSQDEWRHIRTSTCSPSEDGMSLLRREQATFYRFWCLKESLIKAQGVGLTVDLAALSFQIHSPLSMDHVVQDTELFIHGVRQTDWLFEESLLDPNHCVCVAHKKEGGGIHRSGGGIFRPFTEFCHIISDLIVGPMTPDLNDWANFLSKEVEKPF